MSSALREDSFDIPIAEICAEIRVLSCLVHKIGLLLSYRVVGRSLHLAFLLGALTGGGKVRRGRNIAGEDWRSIEPWKRNP
jgi:hypothetical protein